MTEGQHEHVTLQVPGISGGHCLNAIQESLSGLEGVTNIHASVETRLVDVDIDPAKVTTDEVIHILAEAGYPAKS